MIIPPLLAFPMAVVFLSFVLVPWILLAECISRWILGGKRPFLAPFIANTASTLLGLLLLLPFPQFSDLGPAGQYVPGHYWLVAAWLGFAFCFFSSMAIEYASYRVFPGDSKINAAKCAVVGNIVSYGGILLSVIFINRG